MMLGLALFLAGVLLAPFVAVLALLAVAATVMVGAYRAAGAGVGDRGPWPEGWL